MTDELEPYKPIACGLHSEYELAIMHRIRLRLSWIDSRGQPHIGTILPLDITTLQHVEYLKVLTADNKEQTIRLDRILSNNAQEAIAQSRG